MYYDIAYSVKNCIRTIIYQDRPNQNYVCVADVHCKKNLYIVLAYLDNSFLWRCVRFACLPAINSLIRLRQKCKSGLMPTRGIVIDVMCWLLVFLKAQLTRNEQP